MMNFSIFDRKKSIYFEVWLQVLCREAQHFNLCYQPPYTTVGLKYSIKLAANVFFQQSILRGTFSMFSLQSSLTSLQARADDRTARFCPSHTPQPSARTVGSDASVRVSPPAQQTRLPSLNRRCVGAPALRSEEASPKETPRSAK